MKTKRTGFVARARTFILASDFDLKIRLLVGIGVGGDVSELIGVV